MPPLQTPMSPGGMPTGIMNNGGMQTDNTMLAMTETDPTKKKMDKKMILLIACGVVTLLSVIMALVSFVDSGKKANEIKKLKQQITSGGEVVIDGETITTATRTKNPILTATYPEVYNLKYESKEYELEDGIVYSFSFIVREGKILSCSAKKVFVNDGYSEENKKCSFNNISGKIYKFADITDQDRPEDDLLAFLLEDGTIEHAKIYTGLKNMQFNITGKLDAGGFATDIMNVKIFEQEALDGGKEATVITLSDGTAVQYKKNMLHYF